MHSQNCTKTFRWKLARGYVGNFEGGTTACFGRSNSKGRGEKTHVFWTDTLQK